MSDLTLRVSQDSGYLQTLGGLGSPSAPLPVLLFPLCCRLCGLTLEEADLEGEKAEGDVEGDGGQVRLPGLWILICFITRREEMSVCFMVTGEQSLTSSLSESSGVSSLLVGPAV